MSRFVHYLLALLLAPLLLGVINRTKAFFAGRAGQPLEQAYLDIWKLLRKGAVYSRTTSWVFRAGPVVGLAAVLVALAVVPWGRCPALVAFDGDLILFAGALALMRFFTVVAALDTGSAFEGMGASREVQFSALAEPGLLLGLAALAHETSSLSLSRIMGAISPESWVHQGPALALVAAALAIIALTENARIPVDDPNTHLELTMIHEVMVLDHGGPDLGLILYGAALKLWALAALLVAVAAPFRSDGVWWDSLFFLGAMLAASVLVGIVESIMARLRLVRVPQLLMGSLALSLLALILVLR